jgi:peptide/nickel transport system substrate-binding protein
VMWVGVQAITTADAHQQANDAAMQARVDEQTQLLRDLNNEVRRLQDQRRTVDELKDALRSAQPAYVPMYGPPQQQQPQQQQGQAPQPPQQQVEQAAQTQQQVGEGASHAASMGLDEQRLPGPDPNAQIGGEIVEATSEPSTLNMYTTNEGVVKTTLMGGYILEPLFTVSEQDPTRLDGLLATSWEVSEDKLTYTYRLRRGVTWSDGAPFTADDVLFTYNTIMDPAVKSEAYKGGFTDVESVTKVDDFTIQARMKQLYWKSLYVFGNSLFIIPKHWYQAKVRALAAEKGVTQFSVEPGQPGFGELFNELNGPCVGTGPYFVAEGGWVPGESLTMERNPNYWRHSVERGVWNIKTRRVRYISDQLAILNQVRQQKVDVHVVKLDEWQDSLSKEAVINDNYEFKQYDHLGLGFNYIAWNCRKFPFNDRRVRTAMTHLVDRAGLLRDLWRNSGQIATCANKPVYPEYNRALVPHAFDPARAAALLREAGYVDHDGDGVLDLQVDGVWKPFEFTLKLPSGIVEYERIGNKVKESMERVGVRCKLLLLEWSVFIQHLYELDFDAMCLYSSFSDPWIDNYEDLHSSEDKKRGGNLPGLRRDDIDQLVTDMRREFDREKRVPMYHRLYEILHEEQPMTLLIHGKVNVLVHKRLRNVIIRHKGGRQTYWWIDDRWNRRR